MNEYTFPFSTCEKTNKKGIAQPYSVFFNTITCIIIFYFLMKTKKMESFLLLFIILIFESFHVFSHTIHISGPIQINITHILTYCMNLAFFNVFYQFTHFFPSYLFIFYMFVLILLDIYAFCNFSFVYYLATQSLIFISLLFYYYPLLPKFIKKSIQLIFWFVTIIIFLFLNETYNCNKMLSIYPHFPYHIFIEIFGIILFYIICSNFYKL